MKYICLYWFATAVADVVLIFHGVTDGTAHPFGTVSYARNIRRSAVEVSVPRIEVAKLVARQVLQKFEQRLEIIFNEYSIRRLTSCPAGWGSLSD